MININPMWLLIKGLHKHMHYSILMCKLENLSSHQNKTAKIL